MKNFQIYFQKFNNITKKLALIRFSCPEVNLSFLLSLKFKTTANCMFFSFITNRWK